MIRNVIAASLLIAICFAGYSDAQAPTKAISLPKYQPNLPEGPGRELFASACLSCHSERYISMQPPMNATKWEESVRKMMKTFGAPVAEEQVPVIVQYLMAAKENHPAVAWNTLAPALPTTAPIIEADAKTRDKDRREGRTSYALHCASCHGRKGAGDGTSASLLLPKPTNFTEGRYTFAALAHMTYAGVPATAMPGFAALSNDDVRAVVTYTQQLSATTQPAIATGAASEETKLL